MSFSAADKKKLLPLLDQLAASIEELLLTGLTTASDATRKKIDMAFQEASRMRLLRLGSTLRVVAEELSRYIKQDTAFSRQRFMFFLNRAWLLCKGIVHSIKNKDEQRLAELNWTPSNEPVEMLKVVTLGVVKRVSLGAFCAFDFRLRVIESSSDAVKHCPLSWSCVFPLKANNNIPPEGFLHLPQKQKFKATCFLENKTVQITKAALAPNPSGSYRIAMLPDSQVQATEEFTEWLPLLSWNKQAAVERLKTYQPGPLDLEVDVQEEAVLDEWEIDLTNSETKDQQILYPGQFGSMAFDFTAPADQTKNMKELLKKSRGKKAKTFPTMFGLMHYAMCKPVIEPVTIFKDGKPVHLQISDEKVNQRALLQAIRFN